MGRKISLQVVPFPPSEEHPTAARLISRPGPEDEPLALRCYICGGAGKLAKGDACRRCGGTGTVSEVPALRWHLDSGGDLEPARQFVRRQIEAGRRVDVTIHLVESGGGLTNTGHATIVCGLQGERLPSFAGRATALAAHAEFWVHAAMEVRYGHHRGRGSGEVRLVAVDRLAPAGIGVEDIVLWRFQDDSDEREVASPRALELPWPGSAVEAARAKARDYHCRSAYYALGPAAHGPSGALRGAGAAYGGLPSPYKGPGIGYRPTAP